MASNSDSIGGRRVTILDLPLDEHAPVVRLVGLYREQETLRPEEEWHDRVTEAEVEGWNADKLVTAHGQALALGLLETRVAQDVTSEPGRLARCYQVTPTGRRLLDHLGWVAQPIARSPVAVGWG